jgi:hypothetical protein
MNRRMEDRIRKLSGELVAEQDPTKVRDLSTQLRVALHDYIESLRAKVMAYPVVDERRLGNSIPAPGISLTKDQAAILPKSDGAAD